MPTPVLLFTAGTDEAIELAEALGGKAMLPSHTSDEMRDIIAGFGSDFMILVVTSAHIIGWGTRVPARVFFMDGFPHEAAKRIQAINRVRKDITGAED